MANLTKCNVATNVIAGLGTKPDERGLGTDEFKAKFDEDATNIKTYINETLITELDTKFTGIDTNINALYNNSMARHAIIDGGFQIAQVNPVVGTEVLNPASGTYPVFDMWKLIYNPDGGTLPTIKHSQQIENGENYLRINVNGAGSGYGANRSYTKYQSIENGTRKLCGANKKVSLSFEARSSISNKRIGVELQQGYGSGGSPSSTEVINGTNFTLTNTFTKYTFTFPTNTLVGKTFGINNDDTLTLAFDFIWGTGNMSRVNATTEETFVGSGNIEIKNVNLCAGDVALPYMPKSFDEELRSCMRYFEKGFNYGTKPANGTELGWDQGMLMTGTGLGKEIVFKAPKRHANYTITFYGNSSNMWDFYDGVSGFIVSTSMVTNTKNERGFRGILSNTPSPGVYIVRGQWVVDARF